MFTGETFYDNDLQNPQIQRIHLSDSWLEDYVLEVEFTKQELNATNTFCKGISTIISSKMCFENTNVVTLNNLNSKNFPVPSHIKDIISVQNIDPNALKSLVG